MMHVSPVKKRAVERTVSADYRKLDVVRSCEGNNKVMSLVIFWTVLNEHVYSPQKADTE